MQKERRGGAEPPFLWLLLNFISTTMALGRFSYLIEGKEKN